MGKRFTKLPRKTIERARRLYESGDSVASIVAEVNIACSTLYRYVEDEGWSRIGSRTYRALKSARKIAAVKRAGPSRAAPTPPASGEPQGGAAPASAAPPPMRRHDALIERLYNVAERQVADIEQRIGQASESLAARERDARHFSSMVRMMRELAALELSRGNAEGEAPAQAPAPETEDADIEHAAAGYRAELERVLDALHERGRQQEGHHPDDSGAAVAKPDDELELPREG